MSKFNWPFVEMLQALADLLWAINFLVGMLLFKKVISAFFDRIIKGTLLGQSIELRDPVIVGRPHRHTRPLKITKSRARPKGKATYGVPIK